MEKVFYSLLAGVLLLSVGLILLASIIKLLVLSVRLFRDCFEEFKNVCKTPGKVEKKEKNKIKTADSHSEGENAYSNVKFIFSELPFYKGNQEQTENREKKEKKEIKQTFRFEDFQQVKKFHDGNSNIQRDFQ